MVKGKKEAEISSEPISIITEKEEEIKGIIEYPKTKDRTKKFPIIILAPGFLDTKNEEYLKELAKELVKKEYAVVRFDYIHGFGSQNGPSKATISKCMEDIDRVIEYAIRRNYIDEEKVVLVGKCIGGMSSVLLAPFDERVKAVVVINSPMRFINTAMTNFDDRELFRIKLKRYFHITNEKTGEEVRIDYTFIEDGQKKDMPRAMRNLNQPLLIIYGNKDSVIPEDNVKELFEAAKEPKEMVIIEDLEHFFGKEKSRKIADEIDKFLKKFLK